MPAALPAVAEPLAPAPPPVTEVEPWAPDPLTIPPAETPPVVDGFTDAAESTADPPAP